MNELFCFGLGYSADALARRLKNDAWNVSGTATTPDGVADLRQRGFGAHLFDGTRSSSDGVAVLGRASHVLVSIPPGPSGDPALVYHRADMAAAPNLRWIGYLSTIGVYGDHSGAWVDETTPAHPTAERSRRRAAAEADWLAFGRATGRQVQVFRLAGIYGPGRSPIDAVRNGSARRIVKPGQVFNRIHVEDIASVLLAAMSGRGTETIYNVTDDEPAPPQDVVAFAAQVLGVPPPPEVGLDEARLTPMGASFYAENKRVRNARIKSDLGVTLLYPTYREGLRAIAAGT